MAFDTGRTTAGRSRGVVTLRSEDDTAGVDPGHGATLTGWTMSGIDILQRATNTDPLQSACFPLAPYSNLIGGGGFQFDGSFHAVRRNHPLEPAPIHGDAWLAQWTIAEQLRNYLCLSYTHDGQTGFPFRYQVLQRITLQAGVLTISLELTNTGTRPMPAGLGVHPYFRKPSGTRLYAPHAGVWAEDHIIPDDRFCTDREIGDDAIDACFTNWRRSACLHWPVERLRICIDASASACALVVYSPPASDFVCVEPVTNVNDAFNAAARGSAATGMKSLAPGENLKLTVRIAALRSR